MVENEFTINAKVVGSAEHAGAVYFADLRQFCNALSACLRRSETIATGKSGRVLYRVDGLTTGSVGIRLVAEKRGRGSDPRPRTVALFRDTLSALQRGHGLDPRIVPDDVSLFKKLAIPVVNGMQSMVIDDTVITSQFVANADKVLTATEAQAGFVTGLLERLNVHDRCEFMLYPPIDGYQITCIFPEEMLDDVRLAIRRNVTVQGELRYYGDSPFPRLVHALSMQIHPLDSELPSLMDLRGIAPDCTKGVPVAEYVRGLRDDR